MLRRAAADGLPAPFGVFDFASRQTVLAAVSGGSDSLALLLLLHDFLRASAAPTRLIAVTVDHGLRSGSAGEAARVAAIAAGLGIEHRTIAWTGAKPATAIQDAARLARHRLLSDAAAGFGASVVATGHTMDDQAETVAMRRSRGEAGLGASGMAPATMFDRRIWFARPLLGVMRAELRGHLEARGIAWIDDPSNADRRYERVRIRATLDKDAISAIGAEAGDAGAARTALAASAAVLARRHASMPAPGLARLDRDAFEEDAPAARHLFRALLATMGGAARLPDADRSDATAERLLGAPGRASLSGAVAASRKDALFVHREHRGAGPDFSPDQEGLADGRFEDARGEAPPVVAADEGSIPGGLARAARRAEPDAGVSASLRRVVSPYALFLPSFDFALAAALAEAIGARPFEPPPFDRRSRESHNGFYA